MLRTRVNCGAGAACRARERGECVGEGAFSWAGSRQGGGWGALLLLDWGVPSPGCRTTDLPGIYRVTAQNARLPLVPPTACKRVTPHSLRAVGTSAEFHALEFFKRGLVFFTGPLTILK